MAVNVVAYVQELTPDRRDGLWDSPWTCQAVLRALPELAKHYVMRLLFVGDVAVPVGGWG
jgi:transcription initiation factor TFIIH subunit 4